MVLKDETNQNQKIYKFASDEINKYIYFLNFLENFSDIDNKKQMICGNENGLYHLDLDSEKIIDKKQFMEMTSCGVDTNSDASLVAVGDFMGNCYLFKNDRESLDRNAFWKNYSIGLPVRSLTMVENANLVIIGTTNGQIIAWNFTNDEVDFIGEFEATITCLRYNKNRLMASTTEGNLILFDYDQNSLTFTKIFNEKLHMPSEACEKFGSLNLRAEIWSCQFSPFSNNTIITCSEDQTSVIWQLGYPENRDDSNQKLHVLNKQQLKKHNLAVTSVDWKVMCSKLGSHEQTYVADCSDDKVINVYKFSNKENINDYESVVSLDMSFKNEWFTLTYLCLEDNGRYLAVSSQMGNLFVYD